jgi:TonB family protein
MTRKARRPGWVAAAAAVVATLAPPRPTAAIQLQSVATPIFNGQDLSGWIVERAAGSVRDGAIAISEGAGWVRTRESYADFSLTFDARTVNSGDSAAVWIRAWTTVDRYQQPDNGYRISLNTDASGQWHQYRIRCVGRTVEAAVDGGAAMALPPVDNPQGFFLLRAETGSAEFRNIAAQRIAPQLPSLPDGVWDGKAPGVVLPRLRRNPRPNYTAAAMRQQIQGKVLIAAIVGIDGSLTAIAVVQSLDPRYGLDDEAISAAKRWQFEPGTLDGVPVPIRITIELSFTLRA